MKKTGGLGRGLDALIPDSYVALVEQEKQEKVMSPPGTVAVQAFKGEAKPGPVMIPLVDIISNHDQPRQYMEEAKIEELAASLKEQGLIQPVVLKRAGANTYEIICGERRTMAARKNGWTEIPAIIKDVADEQMLELALVENIQREDLNAIEEAEAYKKLVAERQLTPEDVGRRVGRDRTTITNALRILRLPEEVQAMIKSGVLTAGHARALLSLPSPEHQRQMAERIKNEQLSVRQVEDIVQRSGGKKRKARIARRLDSEVVDLEERLSSKLGTKVRIYAGKNNKGRLEVWYHSLDDLDRILDVVGVSRV